MTFQLHLEGMQIRWKLDDYLRMPEQKMIGDCPSAAASGGAAETPYTSVKVLSGRTTDEQLIRVSRLTDAPRRVQHTKELAKKMP